MSLRPSPFAAAAVGLGIAIAAAVAPAHAGAWTMPDGEWYHRLTLSRFEADTEFLAGGDERPFQFDGRFRDLTLTWYGEYGLREGLTLFASVPLKALHYENFLEEGNTEGLFDSDLGARLRLNRGPVVVSLQGLVKVPGIYDATDRLPLGNDQADFEGLVQLGRSIGTGRVYWGAEAGYRLRFEAPSDEWRFRAEIGGRIAGPLSGRAKALRVKSAGNADDIRDVFGNPLAQLESEWTQAELTASVAIRSRWAAELTWSSILDGRSTAKGTTWSLSAVLRL